MATTSAAADRILSLDVIRGIAVMGIFSVNVVGMAMIEQAYFYPPAYGFDSLGDRIMWAANFIVVDGKFRSMFSILFGASMVLVIERAIAAGKSEWQVHYARMVVLLLFGLAHFYLLWWGDILANYALVGMVAFLFWRLPVKWLLLSAVLALGLMYVPDISEGMQEIARFEAKAAPTATPEQRASLEEELAGLTPSAKDLAGEKAAHASIPAHVRATVEHQAWRPFNSVPGYGLETLGLMLLGMAGYKSGFLTGSWSRARYALIAGVLVGTSLALFGYGAWRILEADFAPLTYFPWDQIYVTPMHPLSAIGYCALIMLVIRPGAIADRFAAVGRAAFTNYLGATLIGTVLFYGFGFGLFGELSRGEAWLIVPLVWAVMLLWSKWWLDRFRFGPFEWAWRCLARWKWEPMKGRSTEALPA
ncbi:MAG TPA: DUF418 domain-containing protein [Croceibacterium sp.]